MLELTGLVITFNERENIGRTLARLHWIPRILVLDSFSTDETCEIARGFANVRLEQRAFDSFAGQCNFGLSLIETSWVLSFDADYLCSEELANEITTLTEDVAVAGYFAGFCYCVFGQPLRSTIYPDRMVLYRRELAVYTNEGHGHRVRVCGKVNRLKGRIDHDDRKPLSRWVASQNSYCVIEARHLLAGDAMKLNAQDRMRLKVFYAPAVIFFYLLFRHGLILDGWRGWFYIMQRVISECLLSLRILIERHRLEETNLP